MTDVTGQRHDHNRPHPPERHAILVRNARGGREHIPRCLVEAIGIALRAPIDVPGLGRIEAHEYVVRTTPYPHEHGPAAAFMLALAAGDGPPPLPVALSLAPAGAGVVWVRTRDQWRRIRDTWRARKIAIHSRAAVSLHSAHDQLDLVAGITPIRGDDGRVLPGPPAVEGLVAREALWSQVETQYYSDLPRLAASLHGVTHPAVDAVSTDVGEARAQYLDRIADAAAAQRRWLLDGEGGPAHASQVSALRRLDSRRQAALRAVRAATTVAAATTTVSTHLALIRGAGVEDAPLWQVGSLPNAREASYTYVAPATGRWSRTVRVHNPRHATPTPGAIVLDDIDPPAGWTVTSTPRAAPHRDERDVLVTWASDDPPDAGTHRISITARNAIGPSQITITVTVPAPAAG